MILLVDDESESLAILSASWRRKPKSRGQRRAIGPDFCSGLGYLSRSFGCNDCDTGATRSVEAAPAEQYGYVRKEGAQNRLIVL